VRDRLARAARRLLSTDHKVVAARSLVSGLLFLAVGGALAMVIRWQRAFPGEPVPLVGQLLFPGADGAVTAPAYTALFTSHGLIMIFFAVTPILLGGIGNYVVPLAIGARRMALPRLTALSFWLTCAAQLAAVASLVAPHAPSAGWTGFPPLATGASAPGAGQTAMMVAILLAGTGTVAGALGLLTTVVAGRAPGMTWLRMPLAVWGIFLAAALSALFAPILVAATGLSLLDRLGGTAMFAGGHGDPILYQHLFWIFGHPEVYILILPVWGIVGDLVAFFARKPAFWYRGSVLAMLSVASMSALVYGHHMFRAGLEPMIGAGFEILTLAISAPATVLFVNWLATLWRGALRLTLPMLYALGTIAVLGLGGLSGLFLGSITVDIYLHDTMWVVGHFHLIMATATLLGSFAAIHFWFPKMTGRHLGERLGRIHFWGTLITAVAAFGGMLVAGYAGQPRRYVDTGGYAFLAGTRDLDRWVSYAGFALGAVQLVFFANLIWSARRGRQSGDNPWEVPTLEWSVPSPPPAENFPAEPAVARGPHELGEPDIIARLGRDWIGQWEPPLDEAGPIEDAPAVAIPATVAADPATVAADPATVAADPAAAGRATDRDADLAGPVGMILFLASWSILAGALLLAGVALGARPGWPRWPAAVELAGLAGAAFLLFRPRSRRRAAAGLLAAAGLVGIPGWWPELWPAPPDGAALTLFAAFHLASVAAGAIALVPARPAREPRLLRWYAAALALTWLAFLAAGGAR
jgi:cytochrome c oxidase subunit 1